MTLLCAKMYAYKSTWGLLSFLSMWYLGFLSPPAKLTDLFDWWSWQCICV